MYIKNQTFRDKDTLLEMLFDFGLGSPSSYMQHLILAIDKELENDEAYLKYRNSLNDEDDRAELYAEEVDIRLSEHLINEFDSFLVKEAKLYGAKGGENTLLYEIDLY